MDTNPENSSSDDRSIHDRDNASILADLIAREQALGHTAAALQLARLPPPRRSLLATALAALAILSSSLMILIQIVILAKSGGGFEEPSIVAMWMSAIGAWLAIVTILVENRRRKRVDSYFLWAYHQASFSPSREDNAVDVASLIRVGERSRAALLVEAAGRREQQEAAGRKEQLEAAGRKRRGIRYGR